MPKIPRQVGRSVMPNVGGGGGAATNARSIASSAGQGAQQAGAAIASAASGLGQAFAHAGAVRDQIRERAAAEQRRIDAHIDSLNQRTGAQRIAMDYSQKFAQDKQELYDQLLQQQGEDNPSWQVKIRNSDGTLQEQGMAPEDAMRATLNTRMDEALEMASVYGPEARAHVADALSRDGQMMAAQFNGDRLKLKHDKALADYDKTATRMEDRAADLTNRFREKEKLDLADYIQKGVSTGALSPTEGRKELETRMGRIADKYWNQYAVANPDQMLKIGSERKAADGTYLTGKAGDPVSAKVAPGEGGQLEKLAEDLDPTKLAGYLALATAQKTRQYTEIERLDKANAAKVEQESKDTYNEVITVSAQKDNSIEIEKNRAILGTRYDQAVKFNHEWNNARRQEVTRATTDASQFTQFDLMSRASLAKWKPELLDPTNPEAITNEVVRQHVIGQKDLMPEHAAPILAKINEAQAYHEREDSGKRMAEKDGFALIDKVFFVPQNIPPQDAFELKRLQADAESQLGAEYTKNATGDRNEMALTLAAKFTPRVLAVQKASAESIDRELLTMEKAWPTGFADAKHKLNEGTRKQLEKQNPNLRGLFKVYDAKVERWNQLIKVGEDMAKEVKY